MRYWSTRPHYTFRVIQLLYIIHIIIIILLLSLVILYICVIVIEMYVNDYWYYYLNDLYV